MTMAEEMVKLLDLAFQFKLDPRVLSEVALRGCVYRNVDSLTVVRGNYPFGGVDGLLEDYRKYGGGIKTEIEAKEELDRRWPTNTEPPDISWAYKGGAMTRPRIAPNNRPVAEIVPPTVTRPVRRFDLDA